MFKPGDRVIYGGRERVIKYPFNNDGSIFDGYGLVPIPGLSQDPGHNDNQAWASELQPINNMEIGDTVFYRGKPRVITDISPCMNYKLDGEWVTGTPEPYKYKPGDRIFYHNTSGRRVYTINRIREDFGSKSYYYDDHGWDYEDNIEGIDTGVRVGDKVKIVNCTRGQVTAIHGDQATITINLPKDAVEKV